MTLKSGLEAIQGHWN